MKQTVKKLSIGLITVLFGFLGFNVKAQDVTSDLKLDSDLTEKLVIKSGSNVTLDLNGHNITTTNTDAIYVELGATLTVKGDGVVTSIGTGYASLFNNGVVTLNGGTFTKDETKGAWYSILNHNTITVNDGVTISQTNYVTSSLVDNGYSSYSSSTNERVGYVSAVNVQEPKLIINGGTFDGGMNTIKNDDNATLEINGGTFSNNIQVAVMNWNKATINGGVFNVPTGNDKTTVFNGFDGDQSVDKGILTITGGTFNADYALEGNVGTTNLVKITGGNFNVAKDLINPNTKITYTALTKGGTVITGGYFTINPTSYKNSTYVIIDNPGTVVSNTNYKYQVVETYNKVVSDENQVVTTANTNYNPTSKTDLVIVFNGLAENFKELVIDGKVVPTDMYTVTNGSTIITLKAEYLANLTEGKHEVNAVYNDGTVPTILNVSVANPSTLDNFTTYIVLGSIAIVGITSTLIYFKKRNN